MSIRVCLIANMTFIILSALRKSLVYAEMNIEHVNDEKRFINVIESVLKTHKTEKQQIIHSSRIEGYGGMIHKMQEINEENKKLKSENIQLKSALRLSFTTSKK